MSDQFGGWRPQGEQQDWQTVRGVTSEGYSPEPYQAAPQVDRGIPLGFSDGRVIDLTGSALVGRNPTPAETESFDQLVMITDPSLSVSKTHLVVAVSDGELWVADRYSTNGTAIHTPDGEVVTCQPGQWVLAPMGSVVHFGSHWFTVAHTQ